MMYSKRHLPDRAVEPSSGSNVIPRQASVKAPKGVHLAFCDALARPSVDSTHVGAIGLVPVLLHHPLAQSAVIPLIRKRPHPQDPPRILGIGLR